MKHCRALSVSISCAMKTQSFSYDPVVGPLVSAEIRGNRSIVSKMLISTGTNHSYLAPAIAEHLDLKRRSRVPLMYRGDLYFPDFDALFTDHDFLAFDGTHPITHLELSSRIDGIVGRKVLQRGRLTISGMQRQFTLSL